MSETRYKFVLPARNEGRLHAEIVALSLPDFLYVGGSGDDVECVFAGPLSDAHRSALQAAVAAHVPPTDESLRRADAINIMLRSTDPLSLIIRALFSNVYTHINDGRQSRGESRLTEAEIFAQVVEGVYSGFGEPSGGG